MARSRLWRDILTAAALFFAVTHTAPAAASTIRPVFALDASLDCFNAPAFAFWDVYLVAELGGDAAASGITGAEFRIDGFDLAWFTTITPSPAANLSIGNPIQAGCSIAFPTCQVGENGIVLLYTIRVLALAPIAPRDLRARPDLWPGCQFCFAPIVSLCDETFMRIFVGAGIAHIGSDCPTVLVAPVSWSAMKSLYRQ